MKTPKIDFIHYKRSHLGLTVLIYSSGYVFACRWAADANPSHDQIRQSWKFNRRAWRAYDEGTDTFL